MNGPASEDGSHPLARFQDAFLRALLADAPVPAGDATIAGLCGQPGFAVYRNTAIKGCIDALQANYP
ncbi:MAG TPA: putative DNA-binding domain-containing protein, partial [Zeimonas sp.]|nr:putative DNA-binding domain-containing protein [Zeimonas sp.]